MNLKMGFLFSHLGDTELSQTFLNNANKCILDYSNVDIIAFVANQVRPKVLPTFAVMNINEAYDYNGVVFATSLALAEKLLYFPGPRRKYHYAWELDWTKESTRSFEDMLKIYRNPILPLIARTIKDREIIEQCWNTRVGSVNTDCNMEEFIEMARRDAN